MGRPLPPSPLLSLLVAAGPNLGKLINRYMSGMALPLSRWDSLFPDPEDSKNSMATFLELAVRHSRKESREYKKARDALVQVLGQFLVHETRIIGFVSDVLYPSHVSYPCRL